MSLTVGPCAEAALFALFSLGSVRVLRDHVPRFLGQPAESDSTSGTRLVLLLLFLLPFAAYFLIGLFKPRFGHPRNFFYLFPIYLLFAAHGLDWFSIPRRIKDMVVVFIAAALVGGFVLPSYSGLRQGSLEREALGIAVRVPAPLVIVQNSERAWPFKHYVGRLGVLGRVYPWNIQEGRAPREYPVYFQARLPEMAATERNVCVVILEVGPVGATKTVSVFGRIFTAEPSLSPEPRIRVYCDRRN